jgi:predicted phage terminase large subunit-like protein
MVRFEPQTGDKAKRAEPLSSQSEAHNVLLINGVWVNNFLDELAAFPMGRHNDQVDAAAMAFTYLAKPPKRGLIIGGGVR